MPVNVTEQITKGEKTEITQVSTNDVQAFLVNFKERIESEKEKESQLYSFPSDKTRVRILE